MLAQVAQPDPLACLLVFIAFAFLLAAAAGISDQLAKRQHQRARSGPAFYDHENQR